MDSDEIPRSVQVILKGTLTLRIQGYPEREAPLTYVARLLETGHSLRNSLSPVVVLPERVVPKPGGVLRVSSNVIL